MKSRFPREHGRPIPRREKVNWPSCVAFAKDLSKRRMSIGGPTITAKAAVSTMAPTKIFHFDSGLPD